MPDFLTSYKFSTWSNKKVRTIHVSSYSKHPIQRSISKAISIAKPYDRIELTGGDYTESISISIPLEIVASEGEDPHLISRNSVITITNNVPIYLERLRITCKSTSKHEAGVVMSMGTPLLRKCAVNSLIISGAAEPRAEECSISESYNGYGVVVTDSGGGTLHRCTIHSHRKACMYLDTKGKMLIGESKLFNYAKFLGDVLYFSGSSRVGKRHFEASDEGSNCRKVEVKQCQIYVTEEVPPTADLKFLAGEQPPNNITGQPCCIVIEEHAEPHIIGNDLFEGRIGILLDHSGEALLESNTIQKQRRCGVLALVDESVSNGQAHNVKISGENIFKACEIGIEIQRRHPDRETLVTIAKPENIVSRELPAMKDVHQWTSELDAKTADNVRRNSDKEERYFLHESQPRSLTLLKEELRQLSMLVVQGLPSALTHPSTNVVIENLYNTLGTAIELPIKPPSAATEQSLLTLRGNNGVDISRTRFIGCTVCCIHFGRHSYGLVEDCLFDDCKTHAIVVESAARPLIVGCRFYRSVCASILAANFADPLVVGNEFMHGDTHAAQFTFLSRGLFLGNVMSSFHGPAILVEQYSSPLIAGNYVAQNNGGGALITSRSQPTFVFNTFIGNCQQQVDCADSSNPFIAHNQISGGTGNGIRVGSCSRGTMLRNDIFLNSNGILVEVDGDPIVEGNRLVQNTKDGVHCCNNALGTFLGNIMGENCGANIRVKEGSYPVFRDNSITLGGYGGIVITREGSGLFERNSVYQNSLGNIIVSDPNTNPSILRNTISSAHGAGVIFTKECRGNFSRNSLFENEQCGVYLAHGANPSLQQNGIKREVIGVLVSDGGKGSFQKNEISHCYLIGVMCQMEGDPTFNNNTISRCALSGLIVTPCGLGNYTMNEFLDSEGFAVQLGTSFLFEALDVRTDFDEVAATSHRHATPRREKGSSPASTSLASSARHTHTHKRHSKDGNGGMASVLDRCRTRPMCHVKNNRIHHNRRGGVLIDTNAHGELSENEIMDNLNYGICGDAGMTSRRTTHMFGSVVVRIATLDVPSSSTENCSVWVKRNRISSHGRIGIHFNDLVDRNVNVSENEVAEAPIGIYIGHGSEVGAITKNDISRCMDGIVVDSRGTGQFSNNLIHHCSKSGIYVANLGNPIVHEGNVVEHCGIAGVVIDAAGRGHFTKNTFRRCRVGVLAFTGPAAATQVEYEDIISSEFVTSTPVVEDNDIEENELHGVLVLGVTSGMALRGGIEQQDKAAEADATASASQSRTDLRSPTLDGTQSGRSTTPSAVGRPTEEIQHAQGDRLAPLFARNRIRRNRYCGVYLDNFVHWDFGGTSGTGITTDRSRFTLGGYDYTLGTSGILPRPDHLASRELRQVTFKENAITESSIGVGVGDCMHPLLLDNRITKNYFFGIFLRRGSAAMVCRCEMSENGLAGLYAVNGSKGEFVQCHFHRNNGFHRLDGKPAEPRDFSTSPFATKHVDLHDVEEVSCETTAFGSVAVYRQLHTLVKVHRYAFAEAIHALAEVVVLPSDGHSLGSICVPSDGNILTDSHRGNGGVSIHGYIHLHLSDGGLGMWLEEGSGTTVRECSVEGNLNIGVLLSSGLREHHHVISSCLHRMYGRTNPALAFFDAKTAPERPALAAKCVLALFSPHPLWCPTNTPSGNAPLVIALAPNSSNSTSTTSYSAAPGNLGTNLCAKVISCNISGSGTGMLLELHHAYRALPASSTPELGRRGSCASFSSSHTGDVSMTDRHDSGASGFSSRDIDAMEELRHLHQCMCVEENTITNNHNYGILCQHVVEIHCENYVRDLESLRRQVEQQRESPGGASDLVNMFLSRPRYGLEFHLTVKSPVINNVVIRHNTMGKNPNQGEVTSRYVMVAQDLHRALIQMDTVNDFMSQRYNSEVVHRIPVLAAALQYVPPGCFWWDENQICDCERGIRAVGYLGSCSVRLTRNLFRNISTAAVLVDGHLAACTVGRGNIFEDNATAIRLHVRGSKEEASNTDMLSDTRTRIFQNIFRSCRSTAVVFDEGSSNVLLCYNDFSEGTLAPTVWVGSGASELLIHMNIFSNGALPLVINGADEDGISDCSTVTISGNVFTNNYIGALVCHGACPQFQANLFDGNRRCGLEVIGQGTAPKVQRCMFANHTQHQDEKRPKGTTTTTSNGGGHTHTGVKNNPFPDGTVNVGKKKQIIALVESNRGVRSPEHMETLPCGLIIGPLAGGFYEGNYFQNNDFGIDAVRGGASAFVRPSSAARIYRCIFTRNHVGGVLIRGSDSVEAMARSSIQVEGGDHQLASGYQSTRVETCFFIDNGAEEGCGDVIAMTKGCAKFEGNCFHGTIQAQRGGLSFFTHNTFLPSGLGSKGVPAVKQSDRGACILHESSQCKFEHNEISYRKMGFLGLPGSSGLVLENTMFCCTVGATVSPFSTVEISKNRICHSADAAVVMYGGVVSENLICRSPVGIMLHADTSYSLTPVPEHLRSGENYVECRKNDISQCSVDGIVVTAVCHVDSNQVTHCNKGIHVMNLRRNDKLGPVLEGNFVFDNTTGIHLGDNSICTTRENDVFDNDECGVYISASTQGIFNGNRISSAKEFGAIFLPEDPRLKLGANNIRNQFTPAFQQGNRAHRLRLHQGKLAALEEEVNSVNSQMMSTVTDWSMTATGMEQLMANIHEFAKQTTVATGKEASQLRLRAHMLCHGSDRRATTTGSVPRGISGNDGHSGAPNCIVRPAVIYTLASNSKRRTLTHLGDTVINILNSQSLRQLRLSPILASSSTELTSFLEESSMFMCVVVCDRAMREISSDDGVILRRLHNITEGCDSDKSIFQWQPGFPAALTFTILPEVLRAQVKEAQKSEAPHPMSLAEYASLHQPIFYESDVEDSTFALEDALAQRLVRSRCSPTRRKSSVRPAEDSISLVEVSQTLMADGVLPAMNPSLAPAKSAKFKRASVLRPPSIHASGRFSQQNSMSVFTDERASPPSASGRIGQAPPSRKGGRSPSDEFSSRSFSLRESPSLSFGSPRAPSRGGAGQGKPAKSGGRRSGSNSKHSSPRGMPPISHSNSGRPKSRSNHSSRSKGDSGLKMPALSPSRKGNTA